MGTGHVEVLDKLDNLYKQRKEERLKHLAQFSNLDTNWDKYIHGFKRPRGRFRGGK